MSTDYPYNTHRHWPVDIGVTFEWDEAKRAANVKRHGVDFAKAVKVFDDPHRLDEYDPEHSEDEDRRRTLGTADNRILYVVYTERVEATVIRLISARRARKDEQAAYYQSYG